MIIEYVRYCIAFLRLYNVASSKPCSYKNYVACRSVPHVEYVSAMSEKVFQAVKG